MELLLLLLLFLLLVALDFAAARWGYDSRDLLRPEHR